MITSTASPVTYSLGPGPAVDRNALEALGGRNRGLDRPLAFAILDAELCRLAKAQAVLDLTLGKALEPLLDGGYEALGYARLADYCIEHLSFTRRTAELLRQQADRMDRFPVVRQAFLGARINQSHARLLLAHLERNGGSEADLVGLASSLTVRGLKERLESGAECPASQAGHSGQGAAAQAEYPSSAEVDASDAAGERPEPGGVWRHYRLGPVLLAEWDAIVERCQRLEGTHLLPWEVLEILVAEFLSGAPLPAEPQAAEESTGSEAAEGPEPQDRARAQSGSCPSATGTEVSNAGGNGWGPRGARWDRQRTGSPVDWRKMLEEASGCWRWLDDLPVQVELDAEFTVPAPDDPFEAHGLVSKLVLCRRRLDLYIGRMLRTLDHCGLVRQAQFAGMAHYAAERLGIGASTTSRLLRRARKLACRPLLFAAVESGRISLTQADQLVQVPPGASDPDWIAWAGARTCRAVEDAVHDLSLLANLAPEFKRGWHPPADGEDLQAIAAELLGRRAILRGTKRERSDMPNPSDSLPMFSEVSGAESLPMLQAGSSDSLPMFSEVSGADSLPMFSHRRIDQAVIPAVGLRIFIPTELLPLIQLAEAAAGRAAQRELSPEESLQGFMASIQGTYTEFEKRLDARRRRALRRARYRCQAPGCRSRRGLHVHHVIYRSRGGSDDDGNLVVLCCAHHLRGVHGGRVRVRGEGPDHVFEMGLNSGRPLMVFRGDVRIA